MNREFNNREYQDDRKIVSSLQIISMRYLEK